MPQNTRNNSNNKIQFIYGRREPGSRSIKPLETSSYRGEKKKKKERSGQRKSDRRFLGRSRERKFLVGNYIICAKGTCIDNEILDRAPRCTSYDRKIPGNAETTEARKKEKKKEENERDELQNELPSNDGNRGGGCISRGLPRRP